VPSSAPTLTPLQRRSVLTTLRSPRRTGVELLAGLVTALALIPEATAFAIVTGLDPRMGLFGAVIVALITSVLGGRPAMISAAAGSVALVAAPLVLSHGVQYYLAAVILSGAFQVLLAAVGAARLMRFIPRSVMKGFVNALAILIFTSQLPELLGVPWMVYPLVALGLAIVFLFPRLTTAVPAPLVAIVVVTLVAVLGGARVPTVGDRGELPESLPLPALPDVPPTLDMLAVIAPYALAMALVGLVESLLTAKLVDDLTDTHSNKTRESWALGIANAVAGLFGCMGGCAMIGQTMINVKAGGGRTRISGVAAGLFVLLLAVTLNDVVAVIPMAALVAVMVYISWTTFDWRSIGLTALRRIPRSENLIMVVTVLVTVLTHNLALGVVIGTVGAMIAFARRVAGFLAVERTLEHDDDAGRPVLARYRVRGELFFASSNDLYYRFDYAGDPPRVVIDFRDAHVWDASTVAALDSVLDKYARGGHAVEVTGLNEASETMFRRMSGTL
jgi:SulP family sulfate permease